MKNVSFDVEELQNICSNYKTPFYIYDEKAIRDNAKKLYEAFLWSKRFKNFFAVKATPTPAILSVVQSEGMGFDCSSLAELVMLERMGVRGDDIMFTSNNTPAEDMQKACELGAIINLDDISHISFLEKVCDIKKLRSNYICFRYNPGCLKKGNIIIGNPVEAKYGLTTDQIFEAYKQTKELGFTKFGLHTMVASNELDEHYFVNTAMLLFELVVKIKNKLNIDIGFVNLGGGIGIAYKPDDKPIDYKVISKGIQELYNKIIVPAGLDGLEIKMENGRVVTGPYGYLVSKVIHMKHTYKDYVGLDASMADLMRPAIYGAYHHISVLPDGSHGGQQAIITNDENSTYVYDVTGGLCENNDKFAIDRKLPEIAVGDIIIIHDVGAHGHAMGFNYNGKLRSAELLKTSNGDIKLIRKKQTLEDYFSTVIWRT